MNLNVSNLASEKAANAILISGSARSGTTILGKAVHSFKDVEYAFEPPMMVGLLPLIDQLPASQWRFVYETFLYEEFLINALCGRSINCNRIDDSSIYNAKGIQEIEGRLNRSLGKKEAEATVKKYTIAYKMPNIVPYLPRLVEYYPAMRIVITRRGAVETINSLLQKDWFSDGSAMLNMIWPYRIKGGRKIPFWVKEEDDDYWLQLNNIDRCAYYYVRVSEDLERVPGRIEIDYEDLLANPEMTIQNLSNKLGLQFGEKTDEIVRSIKPTHKQRDMELMDKVSPSLAERVRLYSN